MFYKYGICEVLFTLFFLIKFFKCDSSEKSDLQIKYDACYKLIQKKATQEQEHFRELLQELSQEEINNIFQYALFECYQNIDYYVSEELDEKDFNDIDVYQDNYQELANFEKWELLLRKKDENDIQRALIDIQQAYRDIQSGAIKVNRYQKKPQSQKQKRPSSDDYYNYKRDDDNERFNLPSDMDNDFKLFGVNFSSMPPLFKNIIGFSLIILVFLCIIGGLKWIQRIRGEKDKNKKKKNKKEKKEKKK